MNGRQADIQEAKKIRLRERFAAFFNPNGRQTQLSAVTAQVDDSPGWVADKRQPHERDFSEVQALYEDALAAYRKNPIAWRVIATTTNYILGDSLVISSPKRELERFIRAFWDHPENRMDLRLAQMSDELARAGDLFVVLFRNPQDGMSYLRFVTKDRIVRIESAENDWENELAFYEAQESGESRRWLSPSHPGASESEAVMLHYAVNRPCGALLGESDLASMLPWLQRYSRMLEDRVRLHWAMRAFLWVITVPTNLVGQKAEQYRTPPEAGSIVVKDQSEEWQAVAPDLKGADASHDLKAVRGMIDAGSGYPPHWRGGGGEANLATATAMQTPTERHLARRQKYFLYVLQDILYQAYQRAVEIGVHRPLGESSYERLFRVAAPDVSRSDNEALAKAASQLAGAFRELAALPGGRPAFNRLALDLVTRFAGEPLATETLDQITEEMEGGRDA
jgi:hypothetical protein